MLARLPNAQVIEEETFQAAASTNQHLVTEMCRFGTFPELQRSQFYKAHKQEIGRVLDQPRVYRFDNVRPRLRAFLRVVEWNIERGSRLDGIIEVLNNHPVLKFADLLLINELDEGMLRSGNINVAFELGRALSADVVFGVEYIELTKGTGDELMLIGENTAALHGNAILSRHALANPQVTRLPRCQNNFEDEEKRIGGRIAIAVEVEIAGKQFTVGNTHLDVVSTPRCRAKQMHAMLQSLDARLEKERVRDRAVIVGGDLNTHTFARGSQISSDKKYRNYSRRQPGRLESKADSPPDKRGSLTRARAIRLPDGVLQRSKRN
jgi:endonuclease/exonuclease/phosphatase family metal-dependent hydrolase